MSKYHHLITKGRSKDTVPTSLENRASESQSSRPNEKQSNPDGNTNQPALKTGAALERCEGDLNRYRGSAKVRS